MVHLANRLGYPQSGTGYQGSDGGPLGTTFLLHSQKRTVRQRKSKLEKHPFGDMTGAEADRNPPDLIHSSQSGGDHVKKEEGRTSGIK